MNEQTFFKHQIRFIGFYSAFNTAPKNIQYLMVNFLFLHKQIVLNKYKPINPIINLAPYHRTMLTLYMEKQKPYPEWFYDLYYLYKEQVYGLPLIKTFTNIVMPSKVIVEPNTFDQILNQVRNVEDIELFIRFTTGIYYGNPEQNNTHII